LSELHPNYVNRICGYFWLIDTFPTVDIITHYWNKFVASCRVEFTQDILSLSKNQKKILAFIAKNPIRHPSGHEISSAVCLPEINIRQAVRKLMLGDYLHQDSEGFICVLDPALRDFIRSL